MRGLKIGVASLFLFLLPLSAVGGYYEMIDHGTWLDRKVYDKRGEFSKGDHSAAAIVGGGGVLSEAWSHAMATPYPGHDFSAAGAYAQASAWAHFEWRPTKEGELPSGTRSFHWYAGIWLIGAGEWDGRAIANGLEVYAPDQDSKIEEISGSIQWENDPDMWTYAIYTQAYTDSMAWRSGNSHAVSGWEQTSATANKEHDEGTLSPVE